MKNYKIALVEASSPSTHIFSRTYLPRVGLPTIGAILHNQGYRCDIWFQAMPGFSQEKLLHYDIVGIGSLTCTIEEAYRLADFLRNSGIIVVMGGPHVTFMKEEALSHCNYLVIGEGDLTFPELVAALEKGSSLENIPGLVYRTPEGTLHQTGEVKSADYGSLPSPNFYLSPQVKQGKSPPIITTSRGCPHNCIFCSVTAMFHRNYRYKSNEQVISELRPILKRSVCFGDDNFFANPKRSKSLLRDMIEKNAIPLRWSGEMAVKAALDTELLGLMKITRCRIVYVGIESVSPETLKKFRKAHEIETTTQCIENLHNHDIGIHGMFVVDLSDTTGIVKEIVDYAINTDIDTIQICSLTPFPGTESYTKYKDRLLHHEWRYFDGMHVVAEPLTCSAYEMQLAIVQQMQRFYSPKRILGAYRRNKAWRIKYRAGGHVLMKKWVKENSGYIDRLKNGFNNPLIT